MSFPEIISKLPEIGRRGLYRGSIPAILGQFSRLFVQSLFNASLLLSSVLKLELMPSLILQPRLANWDI